MGAVVGGGESVSRRRILIALGLGTAGVAAGGVGAAAWFVGQNGAPGGFTPADTGAALHQPEVIASHDGLLTLRLAAHRGVRLAGRDTSAWGYNGTSPGPTLRVRAGDTLRISLVNRLDEPTNLHTHGLHVSPQGRSDNPFVVVGPGETFDYVFAIPADHPAGTHWYHPHGHGTVADQIFAGLAGAVVIDDPPDQPGPTVNEDRVLVISDTTLDPSGRVVSPDAAGRTMGREGELVLVNGQHRPVIAAVAGTAERWRLINACTSRVVALRLVGHPFAHIALDGAYLAAPVERDRIVLAPGNRADVMVRPVNAGRYELVNEAYDRGRPAMMGGAPRGSGGAVVVAALDVSGPATSPPDLPGALWAPSTMDGPVAARRTLTLAAGMGGGMGSMAFTIDGRTFDPLRDDQTVRLGTTEEWTIVNASPMDHPFHLHAWPFQVVAASDRSPPVGVRQDVALIPANGWARLRIAFNDYSGRSVYHCHILDHEDAGMMATVNVRA